MIPNLEGVGAGAESGAVSPWLLTRQGLYFLANGGNGVEVQRWEGKTLKAYYSRLDFSPYSGTTDSTALRLIGTHTSGGLQVRSLDPLTLKEIAVATFPNPTAYPIPWDGGDFIALKDDRWALLQPVVDDNDGYSVYFSWLDPVSASLSSGTQVRGLAMGDPAPLENPKHWPLVRTMIKGDDEFIRWRDVTAGEPDQALFSPDQRTLVTNPLSAIEFSALPATAPHLSKGRREDVQPVRTLREPTTRIQLQVDYPDWFPLENTDYTDFEWHRARYTLREFVAEVKGGPAFSARLKAQYAHLGKILIASPLSESVAEVAEPSFMEALQSEFALRDDFPLLYAGFSPTDILLVQPVMRPPSTLNGGESILRFGVLEVATGKLSWFGWLPHPYPFAPYKELGSWRIAVYNDRLLLASRFTYYDISSSYPSFVERAISIPLPEDVRSPWWGELEVAY